MPSNDSLPDEKAPGETLALRCKFVSNVDGARCERTYDHPGTHLYGPFMQRCGSAHKVPQLVMSDDWVQRCELPPGHKGQHSSGRYVWNQDPIYTPDSPTVHDKCTQCTHERRHHGGGVCIVCPAFTTDNHHAFVPAEPGTAGVPECACGLEECEICTPIRHLMQPEAPELKPCDICGDRRKTNEMRNGFTFCEPCIYSEGQPYCGSCGSTETPFALAKGEPRDELRCLECSLKEAQPPRRPPYAVAYALASGELYEVALSGDAVATVEHGVLKVSHPQGVAHIVQVKPLEGP